MLVSIVMPVYNGEKYLRQSIESIINQTYKNWELIIVNDCSTDNSRNIMQYYADKDKRINIIDNDNNLKLPQSLNIGFRNSKGNYLTWTSDDNIYKNNAIEELFLYLEQHRDIGLVYSDMEFINQSEILIKKQSLEPDIILFRDCVGASFMYRREIIDIVGEYDINMFLVEDYEYWIRISKEYKIGHLNKNLYKYRVHGESLTGTRKKDINKQLYRLRIKHKEYLIANISYKYKDYLFISMVSQNINNYNNLLEEFWDNNENDIKRFEWINYVQPIKSNKDIVLFGAGEIADKAIQYFDNNKIIYIVDNNQQKIGTKLKNIQIISLDQYKKIKDDLNMQLVMAVGIKNIAQVAQQLNYNGIFEYSWFSAIENNIEQ